MTGTNRFIRVHCIFAPKKMFGQFFGQFIKIFFVEHKISFTNSRILAYSVFLLVFLFSQLYFTTSQNYFIFTSLWHLIEIGNSFEKQWNTIDKRGKPKEKQYIISTVQRKSSSSSVWTFQNIVKYVLEDQWQKLG
jgi:hypothetical protein